MMKNLKKTAVITGILIPIVVMIFYSVFMTVGKVENNMDNAKGKSGNRLGSNPNLGIAFEEEKLKEIWLAGGCFWGVEAYMSRIYGVESAVSGYANGNTEDPVYREVVTGRTGFAETVKVKYDPERVDLKKLLEHYFKIIDPTLLNRQGNDRGTQYRTGIYYNNTDNLPIIQDVLAKVQTKYEKPIVTEVLPLKNFYQAEEYHQDYLEKNPNGYCHIDFSTLQEEEMKITVDPQNYSKPDDETLKETLTKEQYTVTQKDGTERSFQNAYWDNHEKGLYVDIVTGEPLFSSEDKFDSGTGWPSFTKAISEDVVQYKTDRKLFTVRKEVRSRVGDSHLGHVFDDGPKDQGGLRYCVNSAALRFIPFEDLENEGYGEFISLFE